MVHVFSYWNGYLAIWWIYMHHFQTRPNYPKLHYMSVRWNVASTDFTLTVRSAGREAGLHYCASFVRPRDANGICVHLFWGTTGLGSHGWNLIQWWWCHNSFTPSVPTLFDKPWGKSWNPQGTGHHSQAPWWVSALSSWSCWSWYKDAWRNDFQAPRRRERDGSPAAAAAEPTILRH